MATIHGSVGIRWGTQGVASTSWGTSALVQSYDADNTAEVAEIKDGAGETKAVYVYDLKKELTVMYYVAASSVISSASVVIPAQGALMTVTGGGQVSGSVYVVKNVTENAANNDAVKVTVKATEYTGNVTS